MLPLLQHTSWSKLFEQSGKRPFAIVGQDSRASGEFLEAAVTAGLDQRWSRCMSSRQYFQLQQSPYLVAETECRSWGHDFGIT
jgi:hypothetical protein